MNETQQLIQRIEELERKIEELTSTTDLPLEFKNALVRNGFLKTDINNFLNIGATEIGQMPITGTGTTSELYQMAFSVGKDNLGVEGVVPKAKILQFNLVHLPLNTSKQDFITAFRDPVNSIPLTTTGTTSGGNTITLTGHTLETNELSGAVINIINSSGTLVESRIIASNTSTVATITGTWTNTTSNATFEIFFPVFFGSAQNPFQRLYTQEGVDGGIRFGIGVTNGGQNGLLYSDAIGDLYWRNKGGAPTKLN